MSIDFELFTEHVRCVAERLYALQNGPALVRRLRQEFSAYMPRETTHRQNCRYFREYLDILEWILQAVKDKVNGCSKSQAEEWVDKLRKLLYYKEAIMPLYIDAGFWLNHISKALRRDSM